MKIISSSTSKKKSPPIKNSKKNQTVALSTLSFAKMMDEPTDETILKTLFSDPDHLLNNISVLAEELEKIGQDLVENPLPEIFIRYKKHIRILLKGAAKNIAIKEITARVGFTRTKLFRTAQAIDNVLADLAAKVLCEEKNRIAILKLTNQLQGLVLDILT